MVKEKLLTKYSTFNKAFKGLDKDRTGNITRAELETALVEMQLTNGIRPEVVSSLVDLIDDEGEGVIEFDEFAKVLSADNVLSMA